MTVIDSLSPDRLLPKGQLNEGRTPTIAGGDAPHAVVVGAGFGGLAAAVRLGVRGYRVTVVDRLTQPGGRARVFEQNGHVFDAGPTVVTAPFLFEELWTLCGRQMSDDLEMLPVTPFYRIRFDDGGIFDYSGDPEAMRREVLKLAPKDLPGYEAFVKKSKRIFDTGFEKLGHVPFEGPMDMARVAPAMIRLESWRTVHQLVSKYVKNEKLRQVLSFHPLLVGGNPYNTTSIYTLIAYLERKWGVHYPRGGTGALVKGLVGLIENHLGGTIRLGETVEEVLVTDTRTEGKTGRAHGVRLASGETIDADLVVSNADSAWLYKNLIPAKYKKTWTDARVERSKFSMSLFVWYFGTKKKYEHIEHHTILMGPRYKELLADIFDRKVLSQDFSLYLHRPTKTDPSMAPEGRDSFYVLSPVPHLESGVDWERMNEPYRKAVESYLERTLMPDLQENLTASLTLHPKGFLDDYLSFRGAAFGLQPTLFQSASFRPSNRSEDIENLYLVGAGTHPGAGLPGVLS
ncbi:MAG: phytoene desaturase family protein, partial [Myxococcota bacterium]